MSGGHGVGGSNPPCPTKEKTMEKIIVEIHAAEGGADARLLIEEQLDIYKKYCIRRGL